MSKINVKALAAELNVPVEDVLKLAGEKLANGKTGTGKSMWLIPEAADIIRLAVSAPLVAPSKLVGRAKRAAANPSWVYVRLAGFASLVPVAVPRRLRGKILGKVIPIEAIMDATGETTYRYDLAPR